MTTINDLYAVFAVAGFALGAGIALLCFCAIAAFIYFEVEWRQQLKDYKDDHNDRS